MKPLKVVKITEPVYNTLLYVCQGRFEDFKKLMLTKYNVPIEGDFIDGRFQALINNKTGEEVLLIWLDKYSDKVLLHECLHAAIYILDTRKIKINKENDEPFCYFAEWLFHEAKKNIVK